VKKKLVKADPSMMDIIGTILSRLVNVALFIVIAILALAAFNGRTDLHIGICLILAVVSGVIGTIIVRLLFRGLAALGGLFGSSRT
jgi:preprotein translocase subunit SecF